MNLQQNLYNSSRERDAFSGAFPFCVVQQKKPINPIYKTSDACMMKKYLISLNFKLAHNKAFPHRFCTISFNPLRILIRLIPFPLPRHSFLVAYSSERGVGPSTAIVSCFVPLVFALITDATLKLNRSRTHVFVVCKCGSVYLVPSPPRRVVKSASGVCSQMRLLIFSQIEFPQVQKQ